MYKEVKMVQKVPLDPLLSLLTIMAIGSRSRKSSQGEISDQGLARPVFPAGGGGAGQLSYRERGGDRRGRQ